MSPAPPPLNTVLPALPRGAGVAVIRLRSLGDTLLCTPALAALKAYRPDLRLAVLVEPRFAAVLYRNPDLDATLEVPASFGDRLRSLRQLRAFRPALAVGLHGGSTAAWLARLSGAPQRATFLGLRHAWAYNRLTPAKAPPAGRPRLHTVEHAASLFEALGMPETELGGLRLNALPPPPGLPRRYAFFNTSPRYATMRWAPEQYAELARWLYERYGLAAVMAAAGDIPGAQAITGTSIEDLIGIISGAEIFVGSDGGPLHIAAALGKPTVAIFSSTDSIAWAPWQTPHRIVQNAFACNPCPSDRCYQYPEPRCIQSVTLQQVQAAVSELLREAIAGPRGKPPSTPGRS